MNGPNISPSIYPASKDPGSFYDFVIAGAGAAGLSLLVRMIKSGNFTQKRILLIDKAPKTANDRTWCFWEKGPGLFEEVVFKSWPAISFYGQDFTGQFDIHPYRYKMIRGIDFYEYCFSLIETQNNITVRYGNVSQLQNHPGSASLLLDEKRITAGYIFSSIISEKPVLNNKQFYLLQHFKGWVIKTSQPRFNIEEATLMDFRVNQQNGTTFVYVMPFSPDTALVEYTLFSKNLLQPHEYDAGLDDYIRSFLMCKDYEVTSEETGVIPMTNYRFPSHKGNIIHIGTAGGETKPSSGYTFQFIQKRTAAIVRQLAKNGGIASMPASSRKFRFYDSVLLNVLATGKLPGDIIFTHLFRKNSSQRIFSFLDNESNLLQDLKLISSLPTLPFLKAASEQGMSF
ncbi:MAG TPA: lycopene cyclase family protein [Chitinophagaceae bacterium]|nr:lycopene cyclase family protein [Chitinophagaceae bacterium]